MMADEDDFSADYDDQNDSSEEGLQENGPSNKHEILKKRRRLEDLLEMRRIKNEFDYFDYD